MKQQPMRSHRLANQRHHGVGRAKFIKGRGVAKQTPLPELGEKEIRCDCGRNVRTKKDGTIMGHKTLVSKVPCIWVGSYPKDLP